MTPDQTKAAIAVMQAYVDGKTCRLRGKGREKWHEFSTATGASPDWNWDLFEYQIKPEPMEIEVWVHPDGNTMDVSDGLNTRTYGPLGWTKRKFREVLE